MYSKTGILHLLWQRSNLFSCPLFTQSDPFRELLMDVYEQQSIAGREENGMLINSILNRM
jgi:hypothetical protein